MENITLKIEDLTRIQTELRKKNIIVQPRISSPTKYVVDVINDCTVTHIAMGNMPYFTNLKTYYNDFNGFDSYEIALDYGIKQALKIKKKKLL